MRHCIVMTNYVSVLEFFLLLPQYDSKRANVIMGFSENVLNIFWGGSNWQKKQAAKK